MLPLQEVAIELVEETREGWPSRAADALVVGAYARGEDSPLPPDPLLADLLREATAEGPFRGKVGDTYVLPTLGRLPQRFLVLTGLGKRAELSEAVLRRAYAFALRTCQRSSFREVVLALPEVPGLPREKAVQAALIGASQGAYRFVRFKAQPEGGVDRILFPSSGADDVAVGRARAIARGVALARDLVNLPPNHKFPATLARIVEELGEAHGFDVRVLDHKALAAMGAGGILAVGQGSDHPPCAVLLRYGAGNGVPLGLLGKGMTFDSGGLSLKPASSMETMKSDMAGAAAVVGAFVAVAELGLSVPLLGCLMLAENMTGGSAQRPGDVLTMLSGKTVEMLNSDAEGRLILADGVELLRREGVRAVVDLATLTGACVVALGHVRAGLLGNDEALLDEVEAAAREASERLWRMPTDPEYRELLESPVADIKNVGGRAAGMETGGLFIGAFAEGIPWAHLDIAGVAFQEEDKAPLGAGGTGFGTETLVRLAERLSQGRLS